MIQSSLIYFAYANDTSSDPANSTYCLSNNSCFTYYDIDGFPLAPGTKVFLGLDGRGGTIMDDQGHSTGVMAYDSPETASYWKQRAEDSSNSGFCVGPSV